MSASREYARLAAGYDRRFRTYSERTHQPLLRLLSDPGDARIVDVGCGTGLLLESMRTHMGGAHLIGVEPCPEMLARAQRRLRGRVTLLQGCSEAVPVASAGADVVVSSSSLHCVSEPALAIGEFARILSAGGRLLLTDWCADALPVRWMEHYLHCTGRPTYALQTEQVVLMLGAAGFEINHLSRYSAGFPWEMYLVSARRAV